MIERVEWVASLGAWSAGAFWIGLGALMAGACSVVGLGWLCCDAWSVRRWHSAVRIVTADELPGPVQPVLEAMQVKRPVRYAVAEGSVVPAAFG